MHYSTLHDHFISSVLCCASCIFCLLCCCHGTVIWSVTVLSADFVVVTTALYQYQTHCIIVCTLRLSSTSVWLGHSWIRAVTKTIIVSVPPSKSDIFQLLFCWVEVKICQPDSFLLMGPEEKNVVTEAKHTSGLWECYQPFTWTNFHLFFAPMVLF